MARYCFLVGLFLLVDSVSAEEVGSADLNGDGVVNIKDFDLFVRQFGLSEGDKDFVEDLRASDVLPILRALENRINYIENSKNVFVGDVKGECVPFFGHALYQEFLVEAKEVVDKLNLPISNLSELHNYEFLITEVWHGNGFGLLPVVGHPSTAHLNKRYLEPNPPQLTHLNFSVLLGPETMSSNNAENAIENGDTSVRIVLIAIKR